MVHKVLLIVATANIKYNQMQLLRADRWPTILLCKVQVFQHFEKMSLPMHVCVSFYFLCLCVFASLCTCVCVCVCFFFYGPSCLIIKVIDWLIDWLLDTYTDEAARCSAIRSLRRGRWKRGTGKRRTRFAGVQNAGQPSMEREMLN